MDHESVHQHRFSAAIADLQPWSQRIICSRRVNLHFGNSIYISGSHRVNSAMPQNNYGLLLNYPLPLTNNTMPTNWMTIWEMIR